MHAMFILIKTLILKNPIRYLIGAGVAITLCYMLSLHIRLGNARDNVNMLNKHIDTMHKENNDKIKELREVNRARISQLERLLKDSKRQQKVIEIEKTNNKKITDEKIKNDDVDALNKILKEFNEQLIEATRTNMQKS